MKTTTKPLTQKQVAAIIKRNNAAFNKATPQQRRVMIAKDALAQVRAGRFIVDAGSYVTLPEGMSAINVDAQSCLITERCEGCAKAALLVSKVRLGDRATFADLEWFDGQAVDFWPEDNWHLIEVAFEGSEVHAHDTHSAEEEKDYVSSLKAAHKFFRKHRLSETDRLDAILQNIIKNKGFFIP